MSDGYRLGFESALGWVCSRCGWHVTGASPVGHWESVHGGVPAARARVVYSRADEPVEVIEPGPKRCTRPECVRVLHARGLCSSHYDSARRRGLLGVAS